MKPVRIVIFAKAPVPGFAKTRLIPALGAHGAAELARRMLRHTLRHAMAAAVGPVELCVTPDAGCEVWQGLALPDQVRRSGQGEGDLGARMARAAQRTLQAGESVLVIGTDCPGLSAARLRQAAAALAHAEAALLPSIDGGYVALGLNRFHETLFANMAWSTATVAQETRHRLERLGWRVQSFAPLRDIDLPEDLEALPASWRRSSIRAEPAAARLSHLA